MQESFSYIASIYTGNYYKHSFLKGSEMQVAKGMDTNALVGKCVNGA